MVDVDRRGRGCGELRGFLFEGRPAEQVRDPVADRQRHVTVGRPGRQDEGLSVADVLAAADCGDEVGYQFGRRLREVPEHSIE